jgi:hypothetical protein
VKPDPCPLCGKNRAVVGRMHYCVPRHEVDNGNGTDIHTSVINTATASKARSNAERQAKWRAANRDKHRERNRNLMRRRRATEKAAIAA